MRLSGWLVLLGALALLGCDDTGDSCDTGDDCSSGICEGLGCGAGEGICGSREQGCDDNREPYCGCDGQTFYGSHDCPGGRYEHKGVCE